jgi:hypothetical protein
MEFAYDRVKDFCPKCIYCCKIFLNPQLLAHHFVTLHLLSTTSYYTCPHCPIVTCSVVSHVRNTHSEKCCFCGSNDIDKTHKKCTLLVNTAVKIHFQKKIHVLLTMLKGLENI